MDRRKFLQALGFGAAAAPMAGQQVLSASGTFIDPTTAQAGPTMPHQALCGGPENSQFFWDVAKRALTGKDALEEVRAMLYEENKTVVSIDHDIASKRSFSTAAKVVFQRQRNVEQRLADMQKPHVSWRIDTFIEKFRW